MIAGGAIGNVIDRVIHGKVIDFIDVHYILQMLNNVRLKSRESHHNPI